MKGNVHVAVAGATGAVGIEMIKTLERRNFPVSQLTLLASAGLAAVALAGGVTPSLLLGLTFLIGCGSAFFAPAWQAALADRSAHQRFLALVRGRGRAKGRIGEPRVESADGLAGGARYRRLAWLGGHSLLEVTLESGGTQPLDEAVELLQTGYPIQKWQFLTSAQIDGQIGQLYFMTERYEEAEPYLTHSIKRNWMARAMLHLCIYM